MSSNCLLRFFSNFSLAAFSLASLIFFSFSAASCLFLFSNFDCYKQKQNLKLNDLNWFEGDTKQNVRAWFLSVRDIDSWDYGPDTVQLMW